MTFFVQCRRKHFGLDYLLQCRFDISLQDIQIKKALPEENLCLEIKTYFTRKCSNKTFKYVWSFPLFSFFTLNHSVNLDLAMILTLKKSSLLYNEATGWR